VHSFLIEELLRVDVDEVVDEVVDEIVDVDFAQSN
jgi:hypothetical protein